MKKIFLGMILVASMGILSGCLVTDNDDKYERQQFRSTEEISEIVVTDSSTNYKIQVSDTEELLVKYSDSATQSWYNIDVTDGTLNIEKTKETVGVEENSVIITLPEKEYQSIAIETSNGDVAFENVSFDKYKCYVENGDITGTLSGSEADYLTVVKIENGDSNLKDNAIESDKSIEFNVKNGNVEVEFSE